MISVVMPIYNTAAVYLGQALSSVLAQTYTEFELICVDDHSTKMETLEQLAEYERRDERIKVIHLQENVGAGEARNTGLKIASGEYTIFLDADDVFDERLLSIMRETALKYDADICLCGHTVFSDHSNELLETVALHPLPEGITQPFSLGDLGDEWLSYWGGVPWNQLNKTSFLRQNHLCFQSLSSQNDLYFSYMSKLLACRIAYAETASPLVHYRFNLSGQISAHRKLNNMLLYMQKLYDDRFYAADLREKRQIFTHFIFVVSLLMRKHDSRDTDEDRKRFYQDFAAFLLKHRKSLSDVFGEEIPSHARYYMTKSFDSGWFYLLDDYATQLQANRAEILEILSRPHGRVIVWGNGKRGQAIQEFLSNEMISNVVVMDRADDAVSGRNPFGFSMVNHVEPSPGDLVIASNHRIYSQLKAYGWDDSVILVDLEPYCEFESKFW